MTTGNKIEVEFGATTAGVEQGSRTAADAVRESVAGMREAFASLQESVDSVRERVSGAFEGLQGVMLKFNNSMFALQGAMMGGEAFKDFIESSVKMTEESERLGITLGTSATQASYFKAAVADAGLEGQTLSSAAEYLTRSLTMNEAQFNELGIATRDAGGHLRSTMDIMTATNAALHNLKEGTDRNTAGLRLYGRAWSQVAEFVDQFKGVTDESRAQADALNVVVGEEAVEAMWKFKSATAGANEVMEGIRNTVGQALLPSMTDLANWFRSIGPQAVEATRIAMNGYLAVQRAVADSVRALWGAVRDAFGPIVRVITGSIGEGSEGLTAMQFFQNVIKVVEVAFIGFRIAVQEASNLIAGALDQLAVRGRLVGGVLYSALHFDWAGIKSAWAQYKEDTVASMQATMDAAVKIAQQGRADIDAAIMGDLSAKKAVTARTDSEGGADNTNLKPKAGKATKTHAASQMAEFKSLLAKQLQDEGQYFKDSTAEELAYWQGIHDTRTLSVEDARAVNTEIFNLTKKLLQETHDAQAAQIDAERALSVQRLDVKRAELAQLKQAGEISDAEALRRTAVLDDEQYAIERDAAEQRLALYGTTQKQREKIMADMAVAEQKHAATMLKDQTALAAAVQKSWQAAFAPVTSAFEQAASGVIAGTNTIMGAVRNMAQSIVLEYAKMGLKVVANWAANEAAKTLASSVGAAERGAIESAAAAQSVATAAWATIKNIMNYAWEAMAAAYKSVAAIPVVGPWLAPVAAGVAFAGVAKLASSVASAQGGYDIPAGVNPLTQLHEREMVLPAKHADAVRNMAQRGERGGDVHLHVQAVDGESVARLFREHGPALAASLRNQATRFAFT